MMSVTLPVPTQSLATVPRNFAYRDLLPLNQKCLWRLETGVVRTLTWRDDGTLITLGLWGPGDVAGRILSQADPYQIECLTPVAAVPLPPQQWHEATEAMILHIQRSEELMEILHCRQADLMLLRLFAWLAKRFGQAVEQGQRIDLRLTHQDIADLIGLTRVTVTRLVNEFEKQGMIQRIQRQFIVLHSQQSLWHYEI